MVGHALIGRVVKPHGIRGEVVVESLSDVEGRFEPGVVVTVHAVEHTIASSRPHAGRLLVAFAGITDRNAAEDLRGHDVRGPELELDTQERYFAHELVGMDVVTEDGDWLGEVVDVLDLPRVAGYELLEVDRDGQRWLLPSDDDLVEVGTDDSTGSDLLIVVDPPHGLLPDELDAATDVERPVELDEPSAPDTSAGA